MVSMPRLEASGDAVWFQGESYRVKMATDQQAMLDAVVQRAAEQRAAERISTEPFAPPGRSAVLPSRVAETLDVPDTLRVAPPPATPTPKDDRWHAPQSGNARARTADGAPKTLAYRRP